jgi:hypothetical protein
MKILCTLLLKLKNLESISPKKALILILIAFSGGQLSPELINLLLNAFSN